VRRESFDKCYTCSPGAADDVEGVKRRAYGDDGREGIGLCVPGVDGTCYPLRSSSRNYPTSSSSTTLPYQQTTLRWWYTIHLAAVSVIQAFYYRSPSARGAYGSIGGWLNRHTIVGWLGRSSQDCVSGW